MNFENVATILGLLGIGGFIGTYFRLLWERKNTALQQKQDFKETRYKCIILLLLSCIEFDKKKPMLHQHGRTYINSVEDLKEELKLEWNNMLLFASEEVLVKMNEFIKNSNHASFHSVAMAMRKDLWGGKLSSKLVENL